MSKSITPKVAQPAANKPIQWFSCQEFKDLCSFVLVFCYCFWKNSSILLLLLWKVIVVGTLLLELETVVVMRSLDACDSDHCRPQQKCAKEDMDHCILE